MTSCKLVNVLEKLAATNFKAQEVQEEFSRAV
jgi:hypothetical protein